MIQCVTQLDNSHGDQHFANLLLYVDAGQQTLDAPNDAGQSLSANMFF